MEHHDQVVATGSRSPEFESSSTSSDCALVTLFPTDEYCCYAVCDESYSHCCRQSLASSSLKGVCDDDNGLSDGHHNQNNMFEERELPAHCSAAALAADLANIVLDTVDPVEADVQACAASRSFVGEIGTAETVSKSATRLAALSGIKYAASSAAP